MDNEWKRCFLMNPSDPVVHTLKKGREKGKERNGEFSLMRSPSDEVSRVKVKIFCFLSPPPPQRLFCSPPPPFFCPLSHFSGRTRVDRVAENRKEEEGGREKSQEKSLEEEKSSGEPMTSERLQLLSSICSN